MSRQNYIFTSESVSEGHPDKVCDRISDEIVDLVYREAKKTGVDPWSVRVACETLATTNRVIIAGEVRVPESLMKTDRNGRRVINPAKFKSAARKAIRAIGYEQDGFHWKTVKIDVLLHPQSADIAQGVDSAADRQGEEGAGDQGIMFGYACTETPDLMPAPIYYSHKILELLAAARHKGEGDVGKLGPDAKSQVTVRYENGKAVEATEIVLSTQHLDGSWDSKKVREVVEPYIRQALGDLKIADGCNWYINPTGKFEIGGPDAKSQVTVRYENGKAVEATEIVLSTQHLDGSWDSKKVREVVEPYIRQALGDLKIADGCNWYINPTDKFEIGGPDGDAGVTGRKIIVDTYGGAAPHGGGAFSGKDTTKVDRSAAYVARYLAKNVVAAKLAERCTIQLAYAIGVAQPLSVYVDLHGTGKGVTEEQIEDAIRKVIDLSPTGIRKHLDLNRPIYAKTSAYGHFGRKPGRDGSFSWERTDLTKVLKDAVAS